MSRLARSGLLALVALAGMVVAIAAGSAGAAPTRHHAAHPRSGRLSVGVEVLRFSSAGRQMKATGMVTANLTDNTGHTSVVHDTVALTAATGGGCRVLHLFLNELSLKLLGLNAHLDKVTLDVTGNRGGGVLGSLFCRLAHARVASTRSAAARALTAQVRRHRGHAPRFTANLNPTATRSQAPNPECPVLDLVVGPLDLQLLGLVVNLNRVHLSVTATRGQGKLGDTFCQLADNSTTMTTSSTTG